MFWFFWTETFNNIFFILYILSYFFDKFAMFNPNVHKMANLAQCALSFNVTQLLVEFELKFSLYNIQFLL